MVNLFFHVCNTLLLFLLLRWMTGAAWRSGIVAALFAVHPMHVESVAWVAERKDMLSTFLELLTIAAYLWYVHQLKETADLPGGERFVWGVMWYVPIVVLFALTLMAKPMPGTLPCLLLLLDYWPLKRLNFEPARKRADLAKRDAERSRAAKAKLGRSQPMSQRRDSARSWEQRSATPSWASPERIERALVALRRRLTPAFWLVLEKLPLLALTAASSVITYVAQQQGVSMASPESLPPLLRFSNVLTAYVRYIIGMVWPFHLTMFYPYSMNPDPCQVGGAALLLLEITCLVVVGAYFGRRYLAVGWFWFLGTLIPVIGIVQVGDQSMADRYSYFTFTGLFILVVWLATELLGRWLLGRVVLAAAAVASVAGCTYLTIVQVDYWQDTIAALEHTLQEEPDNPAAENNLGVTMWETAEGTRGDKPDTPEGIKNYHNRAIKHWKEAVRIRPQFSDAWNNLGCALRHREEGVSDEAYNKRLEEAVQCFLSAIHYKAEHADAHSNLAMTLWQLAAAKEKSGAVEHHEEVSRLRKGAVEHYEKALELKWDHLDARTGYAQILGEMAMEARKKGHTTESEQDLAKAVEHVRIVIHLDEQNARAFELLGRIEEMQGKHVEATRDFKRAAWLFATNPRAAGRNGPGALALASKLVQESGGQDAKSLDILAAALAELQRYPEAVMAAVPPWSWRPSRATQNWRRTSAPTWRNINATSPSETNGLRLPSRPTAAKNLGKNKNP